MAYPGERLRTSWRDYQIKVSLGEAPKLTKTQWEAKFFPKNNLKNKSTNALSKY